MWSETENQDWALRLHEAGKTYRIYDNPRDRIIELLSARQRHREFIALQPLTLTISKGMSLGIVGDNGAGKSTLLHLLAGSHQPTQGTIERQGRILGLLELGVGFHPEFSGRDNIFLYADILGIDRAFVQCRYPEIVAFAELEAFMEQPLRTYSTGMRVRLAFALVASLDPDVLIIDEALAVGDMHFQKKCIDRMVAFRQAGKTIVLCSHSLYQIGMFCDHVLWLQGGRLRMQGTPEEVLPAYEAYQMAKDQPSSATNAAVNAPAGQAKIIDLSVSSPLPMQTGDDLVIEWSIQAVPDCAYGLTLSLKMDSGRGVFVTGNLLRGEPPIIGSTSGRLCFPQVPLMGGEYTLHLRVLDDTGLVLWDEAMFQGVTVVKIGREMGVVRLPYDWQVCPLAEVDRQ